MSDAVPTRRVSKLGPYLAGVVALRFGLAAERRSGALGRRHPPYRDRLRRRRAADPVVRVERQQRVEFGIIAGDRPARHRIVDQRQPLDPPRAAVGPDRFQRNRHARIQPARRAILRLADLDHPCALPPPKAVGAAMDVALALDVSAHLRQPHPRRTISPPASSPRASRSSAWMNTISRSPFTPR